MMDKEKPEPPGDCYEKFQQQLDKAYRDEQQEEELEDE